MAFAIPSLLLKQLYTFGSLKNGRRGVCFTLKNRLSDAEIIGVHHVKIGDQLIPLTAVSLELEDGQTIQPHTLTPEQPLSFPLRQVVHVICQIDPLPQGKYPLELHFSSKPFGSLTLKIEDTISEEEENVVKIPRNNSDDYSPEIIAERQKFVGEFTGKTLEHLTHYSFDPHTTQGNIENFTGVAQIPIGFAGPILINGEHAQGEFLIPLATTEGTLVASYNRGIKVLNQSGGVTCSIVGDSMQRAPVFVFEN